MDLLNIRKQANRLAVKNAMKIVPIYVFVELILFSLMMFVKRKRITIFIMRLISMEMKILYLKKLILLIRKKN